MPISGRATRPHFILIGAPKSGTTWILETLRAIKCVFMPAEELHYFSRFYTRKTWQWYLTHFSSARVSDLIGENSNTYLTDEYAAARIRSDLPDAKLLTVLRNPIERAYSGYCMQLARGKASTNLEMSLDPRTPTGTSHIVECGRYYVQLRRYFDLFPEGQIFVMTYDDMLQRGREVLVEMATFLRLSQPELVKPLPQRVNARRAVGFPYPVRRIFWPLVRREATRKPVVKLLRRVPGWQAAESMLAVPIGYPPLSDDVRRRLAEYYAEDVSQLSHLLRRDLSFWLDVSVPAGREQTAPVRA